MAKENWNTRPIENMLKKKIEIIDGMFCAAQIEIAELQSQIDRLKIQVANRTKALEEYRHEIDHLTQERDEARQEAFKVRKFINDKFPVMYGLDFPWENHGDAFRYAYSDLKGTK